MAAMPDEVMNMEEDKVISGAPMHLMPPPSSFENLFNSDPGARPMELDKNDPSFV